MERTKAENLGEVRRSLLHKTRFVQGLAAHAWEEMQCTHQGGDSGRPSDIDVNVCPHAMWIKGGGIASGMCISVGQHIDNIRSIAYGIQERK